MNGKTWMRAGPNSPAHWIKFSASYYTSACGKIISKDTAQRVKFEAIGQAGAPGQFVYRPEGGAEICDECARKAVEQS